MRIMTSIFAVSFFCLGLVGAANAQDNNNVNKNETKNEERENDRKIEIKEKPRADSGGICSQSSGVVRLRVTFDKSKKVTDVEVVSSSRCNSFDRNAVRAAKKIKFNPEIRNGEPVTITKLIEYTYTVY